MNIKVPLTLAGAVAVALGAAPLTFAQTPSYMAPPTMATAPSTATSMTSSSAMTTSSRTGAMASPTMMTSSHAGAMHNNANMSKSEIMRVQRALRGLGYYVKVDGVWGQSTTENIKNVQFKNGLKVTGRPDADTMRALGLKGTQGPAGANMNTQSSGMMRSNRSGTMSSSSMTSSGSANMQRSSNMRSGQYGSENSQMNNGMHNMHKPSRQEVMQIQRALKQKGYNVQVNGMWGQQSRNALMQFQKKNDLRATGRPDRETMRALGVMMQNPSYGGTAGTSSSMMGNRHRGNMSSTGTNMRGSSNMMNNKMHANLSQEQIKNVQMRLSQQGYQVDQSGKWDNQTRSALIRFQKKNGIRTTGYPGPKTRRALNITSTMWQSWSGRHHTMPSSTGTAMSPSMGTS